MRKRPEYLRAQSSSHRVTSARLVFLFAATRDKLGALVDAPVRSRFGVVVTRKVGPAVVRNRLKRVLREAFRLRWQTLLPPGVDVVVIARQEAGARPFALPNVLAETTPLEALLLKRAQAALQGAK